MENDSIKLFESKKIRTAWNEEEEKWYFSVVDVVAALTDSANPTDYLKKMRQRDPELSKGWGQIVTPLSYNTAGGPQKLNFADTESILRIIQSIPSPKAEPFKRWMAKVASERIDQLQDPELSIQQALRDYKRLGYSDNWINQRVKSIETRKELTDEWKRGGMQEGRDFALLTDIITKAWSDKTTGEYKKFKGLKKENLRDNMTNLELALNTLAEAATTEFSKQYNPKGVEANKKVAKKGGDAARAARENIEKGLGRSIISPMKASDYIRPIEDAQAQELPFEDQPKDKNKGK